MANLFNKAKKTQTKKTTKTTDKDVIIPKFGIKKSRDTIGVTLKNHLAVYVNRKGDGNPYWYSLTPKGKAFLESEIRVK